MAANGLNDDDAEEYASHIFVPREVFEALTEENAQLKRQLAAAQGHLTASTAASVSLTEKQEQILKDFAAEQVAKMAIDCLEVGKVYRHPATGRLLRVTAGSFLGGYGRVSNWWQWQYLTDDYSLLPQTDQGYGWKAKPIEEPSP